MNKQQRLDGITQKIDELEEAHAAMLVSRTPDSPRTYYRALVELTNRLRAARMEYEEVLSSDD